jgi:hypothetical protein
MQCTDIWIHKQGNKWSSSITSWSYIYLDTIYYWQAHNNTILNNVSWLVHYWTMNSNTIIDTIVYFASLLYIAKKIVWWRFMLLLDNIAYIQFLGWMALLVVEEYFSPNFSKDSHVSHCKATVTFLLQLESPWKFKRPSHVSRIIFYMTISPSKNFKSLQKITAAPGRICIRQ